MKKALFFLAMVLVVSLLTLSTNAHESAQERKYKIGVFFWHESSIDYQAFDGIKNGFETADIECDYDIQKAMGSEDEANKIIHRWAAQKPDLIYGMGTGATIRLMKVIKDIPIVFTAVTNPVQSGITPDWKSSGRNIAGNSNWIETEHLLEDFKEVVPELKHLGVMYDPDNPVSSMEIGEAEKIEADIGIKIISKQVKTINDLIPAAKFLVSKKVETIWVPIDILVYKNLDKVRTITDSAKIPLVASSHRGIKTGAIFGSIVNYSDLGKRSVSIALKILAQDMAPKDIPIGTMRTCNHIINLKIAKEIGYDIPLSALATASEIIK
ncbi:putative ABC transport system substrate-binding protein [Candidatus Magnetomoraceae bacterium gMMP-15]